MFGFLKAADPNEVQSLLTDLANAYEQAQEIIELTKVYPDDKEPDLLSFESGDFFENTDMVIENNAFRQAAMRFKADVSRIILAIEGPTASRMSIRQLKQSRAWLDKNYSYMLRSREEQITIATSLRANQNSD